jgi:hypothetical protein
MDACVPLRGLLSYAAAVNIARLSKKVKKKDLILIQLEFRGIDGQVV